MAKNKYLKLNKKNSLFDIFLLIVLFLLLSLIIPAIGIGSSTSVLWISIVNFFESVKLHFSQFWMFYSFIALVIFAYLGKPKK